MAPAMAVVVVVMVVVAATIQSMVEMELEATNPVLVVGVVGGSRGRGVWPEVGPVHSTCY